MAEIDKAPTLLESLHDNNGVRSRFQVISVGGSVPTHYHEQFDEIFEIVEGEATLWIGKAKTKLIAGQSVTAKKNIIHAYKVKSGTKAVVNVTLEPGNQGFENVIKIMNGLQAEEKYDQLSRFTWSNIPLLVNVLELTNANMVGFPKFIMKILSALHGKNKIATMKQELLEKYCQ